MTQFGTEPSFRAYLQILRHRKWWVASITALGLAAGLAFSLTTHKQYSATAQLLVQSSVNAAGLSGVQQQPVTQTDVQTELQLVTSAPVQQAVRARLKTTPAVSASQVGQTNVMAITATSGVPSQASLVANLYATAFVQYRQAVASRSLASAEAQLRSQITSLEKQLKSFRGGTASPAASALFNQEAVLKQQLAQMQVSGAVQTGDVVLVTPAQIPTAPSSPKPVQDALLGLAAGLALGSRGGLPAGQPRRQADLQGGDRAGRGRSGAGHDPGSDVLAAAGTGGRVGLRADIPGRGVVPVAADLAAVRTAGAAASQRRGHQPWCQ